jgi:hypothetical protein
MKRPQIGVPGWFPVTDDGTVEQFWSGEAWDNTWRRSDGGSLRSPPASVRRPEVERAKPKAHAPWRLPPSPERPSVRSASSTAWQAASNRSYLVRLSQEHAQIVTGRWLPQASWGAAYNFTASQSGLRFKGVVPEAAAGSIGWDDVTALAVQDATRFTATRLVTLGLAGGLALKKPGAILSIGTRSRGSVNVSLPGIGPAEIETQIRTWDSLRAQDAAAARRTVAAPDPVKAESSPAERLRLLDQLMEEGLISVDERHERRNQILSSL